MLSTARRRLTPSNQGDVEHWHYSYCLKLEEETYRKKSFVSIITKALLDGLFKAIDSITWYVGIEALSV